MEKELWDRINELKDAAEEVKKSADNLNKVRSGDQDKQTDGATGMVRHENSIRGKQDGASGLSTKMTDQSLDYLGQLAHAEKEILDNVGKTTQTALQPDAKASSPPSSYEQAFQKLADKLVSSPATVQAFANAERAWEAKMEALRQQRLAEGTSAGSNFREPHTRF